MRTWLIRIVATLILAAVFHLLTVRVFPTGVMAALSLRSKDMGLRPNTFYHAPRIAAGIEAVVNPSPDLLYSVCAYDVSKAPLRITAEVPDTYWSLSCFASNTDNFFVINDRQIRSNPVGILLVRPGRPYPNPGNALVVVSPTTRGAVLIRMLITDEAKINDLIRIQRQAFCNSLD
jgi:uncharacterized membrane protein